MMVYLSSWFATDWGFIRSLIRAENQRTHQAFLATLLRGRSSCARVGSLASLDATAAAAARPAQTASGYG